MQTSDNRRRSTLILLTVAIVLGGLLRFYHLGASELSPDEAASWAAAAAPSVSDVIRQQARFNPGKLAVYELVLHGWIARFGDGLTAIRALSALLGIGAIVLVFWVARELLMLGRTREPSTPAIDQAAAFSAMLFAVTLTMIRFARESRMYPLLMAAILAQTGFLLRSRRRGGFANYAPISLFTAVSIATNFTAVFVIAAQGLWLLSSRQGRRDGIAWKPLAALAAGVIALAPLLAGAALSSVGAMDRGALNWISPPSPEDVFSFFNLGTGTLPFPVLLVLALWGIVSQWHRLRDATIFALFWMYGPVLLLYATSLAVTPLLVERYALSSFVPFLILAAVGVTACPTTRVRNAALALAVVLSIGHTADFLRKPASLQWVHAMERIRAYSPAATIAVVPAYATNVLHYYLPRDARYVVSDPSGLTDASCAGSGILLLWDHALDGPLGKKAEACKATFAHLLFSEKDVAVLTR